MRERARWASGRTDWLSRWQIVAFVLEVIVVYVGLHVLYRADPSVAAQEVVAIVLGGAVIAALVPVLQFSWNCTRYGGELNKLRVTDLESRIAQSERANEELRRDIAEQRSRAAAKPLLALRAYTARYEMIVEVENVGGQDVEVQAQVRIVEGDHVVHGVWRPTNPYYGVWEGSGLKSHTNIGPGLRDKLLIGRLDVRTQAFMASWEMCYWDAVSEQAREYGTTSWIIGRDSGTIHAEFTLDLVLSGSPALMDGPVRRVYRISDLTDWDNLITEHSLPEG